MKNHFYSTLRRELRKILRNLKGDKAAEPSEVSVAYVRQLVRENNIPYTEFDNANVRDLLIYLDETEKKGNAELSPPVTQVKPFESKYSLYLFNYIL